ncbi:hypothetical protein DAEQUDRAFT_809202 [Daedalea quercina L-15889]|uniref:Uncharacterized protein n=1 Tax=Daedalea quercina L-15889 TaxID=1314783 RepID=A0A165SPZ2_9APHY|nr:hypothetical protein DAEQUDRAFT_809202 [Daedalea quercina L-15889]
MDANVLRTLQPVDLQQLARKYNIADNLTNETTIDLLLEAFSRGVGEGDNANISKTRDANTCAPLASQGPRGGAVGNTSSAFEDPNSSMVVERSSPEPGQGLLSSGGEPLYGSPADGDRGHGDQANGPPTNGLTTNGDPAAATRPGGAGRMADRERGRQLARYRRKAEREEEARRDAARRTRRLVHQARHDRASSPVVHELDDASRINTVRLFRRVHNTIEHEYYALDDLQERAQAALQKSLSYTKSAMMARASTYRFGGWLSYYQPGPAKWPTKEIWGEDPRARTFRQQADGMLHEEDEQTGTLPFYSRKRGPDDVPTELPHARDTPPLEKKLKRLGVLVTQERAEKLFRDIRCLAPPTKKRKITREEEKGKAVDDGQVNAVDKGKGKAVDKGKGKVVDKEKGKAVESAPPAVDDAETHAPGQASGTDKNKKRKGNGRKKQAIDDQNVTVDPNLIVDPNAMLDPSAPPRSIAQSKNLRVRHNDIPQTLSHIMKWNLARMIHGEPPYAWSKFQTDKNGHFYSEAIGFLTYGGHIVPGPVPGGHGLVFSDNVVEPGRNDPVSSSGAGLSTSASGVDQRNPDIGSAARSRDLPVVSSNIVFDRSGGTTPGAKQPSASASVDHAAPGVPPDQSAPDASLSQDGRSQSKRSSNDDDGEEEEEDVLELPPLGGYAYGPADPWHKWLMNCLLQQMALYAQRPIRPVANVHPGPSTNSTIAAQQPRAVEHQRTTLLMRNDHPPHPANLPHTAHTARPREDVGLVAQLPLSPTPSSSRFNGTALLGSSEMNATLQPSGSAPLRSNAGARLASPVESPRGSVPRLKPVARTSANVSGSAVALRGDAEQVPPAVLGATPEQHDDAMDVDVDETTDSDEPISGVAARIINVKGSYDLNGAAEARRYLDATRRASARDNTNSPVTPRTRTLATPENPLVLPVLSSPLPPSDSIPEDTNSVPEGSGNRLSAVPSVLDTSARQNLEREIFGTPEPGGAESTVHTETTRAESIKVNPVFPPIPEVDEDEDMTAEKSIESMLVPQSSPGADRLANVVEHSDDDRPTVVSPAPPATPPRRVTRSRSQLPSSPPPRRMIVKRATPSSRRGKAA